MSVGRFLQQAAAGNAGGEAVYVDDVFATTAFEGNSGSSSSGKYTNVNLEVPLADYTGTSTFARFKGSNEYVRHGGMNNAGEVLGILQLNDYEPSTNNKLIKIKQDGTIAWWKDVPAAQGTMDDIVGSPGSSNFYLFYKETISGTSRQHIAKINSDGDVQWTKYFDNHIARGGKVAIDSSDNVYVLLNRADNSISPYRTAVVKLNSSGAIQWQTAFQHSTNRTNSWYIDVDTSGNVFVGGTLSNNTSNNGIILFKLNSSGVKQWGKSVAESGSNGFGGIVSDSSGNIYQLARYFTTLTGCWLTKYDSDGNRQWSKEIRDSGESLNSVHVATDGTYIYTLCTFIGDYTNAQSGRLITAWDSSGNIVSKKHITTKQGIGATTSSALRAHTDGTIVFTGASDRPGSNSYDPIYLVLQDYINFDGDFGELVIQDETLLSASNITDTVTTIGNEYGPSALSTTLTLSSTTQTYSDTSADEQVGYAEFLQQGPTESDGGMVWLKRIRSAANHYIFDTERGATKYLSSNTTSAEATDTNSLTSFNPSGFTVGPEPNVNDEDHGTAAWTFRKYPGFFDVVTYTGDGVSGRAISHNLGSTPGCMIIKRTSGSDNWVVWHRSLSNPQTKYLYLNGNYAELNQSTPVGQFGGQAPTSTEFYVGPQTEVNSNGQTYVAYLFAHDAQDFGTDSDESIIKCGSFTTDSSGNATVNLGFEPQWLLIKKTNATGSWAIFDSARAFTYDQTNEFLNPSSTAIEANNTLWHMRHDGFNLVSGGASNTFIYVAIRRPHKPASSFHPTELFQVADGHTSGPAPKYRAAFSPDMLIQAAPGGTGDKFISSRITRTKYLKTNDDAAELNDNNYEWHYANGAIKYFATEGYWAWLFRRAPGFFDVVTYTGTGAEVTVPHKLGVVPELILNKARTSVALGGWYSLCTLLSSGSQLVRLDSTSPASNEANLFPTAPTAENYYVDSLASYSGADYISYLFASVDGISKVGTYTGTGADLDVDCGFDAPARFVLIKPIDQTVGWYLFDYLSQDKGMRFGNDAYITLNSTAAGSTAQDYIDPFATGFTMTAAAAGADLNDSGQDYLFLAIA